MAKPAADNRALLRNVKAVAITLAVTVPLGIITRLLVPRYLGSEEVGKLYFAESFPTMLLSLCSLGLGYYIHKAVPARHEHAGEILVPILILQSLAGLALSVGILTFMYFSGYDASTIELTALLCVANVIGMIQFDALQKVFFAIGRVKEASAYLIVEKIMLVVLTAASLLLGKGVFAIAVAMAIPRIVYLGIALRFAYRLGLLGGKFDMPLLKKMLSSGGPFFLAGIITNSNGSIDSYFLQSLAGFTEVGLFGQVFRQLGALLMLVPVITNGIMPALSRAYHIDAAEYQRVSGLALRSLLIICLPMSLGVSAFAQDLMPFLYGEKFREATLTCVISGPILAAYYLAMYLGSTMVFMGGGRRSLMTMTAAVALNATLDVLFIPLGMDWLGTGGGAAGAAMGSLVVETFVCCSLVHKAKPDKLWSRATLTAVFALLPALLLIPLHELWFTISLPLRIAIFAVFLPAYSILTGMIRREEREFLFKLLPRRKAGDTVAV